MRDFDTLVGLGLRLLPGCHCVAAGVWDEWRCERCGECDNCGGSEEQNQDQAADEDNPGAATAMTKC